MKFTPMSDPYSLQVNQSIKFISINKSQNWELDDVLKDDQICKVAEWMKKWLGN
jgi:hypothetical protein